jgi:cellulose synthase/poly-beta-1,6-N-acetylglucosamine synthase-like glycosyltransferase
LVDDFVLGMKVREQGYRLVYEPRAVAEEELPDPAHEWRRRVRIGAGDYQALVFCRRCLLPRYGRFAWMFWSHKALRWFTPHVAVALAVTLAVALGTTGLRDHTTTGLAVVAASLLAASAVGKVVPRSGRAFRAAAHLVAMNAALLVGFLRFCRGGLGGTWERTPRG